MKITHKQFRNFLLVFGLIFLWTSPFVLLSHSSKPQIYVGMDLLKQSQVKSDKIYIQDENNIVIAEDHPYFNTDSSKIFGENLVTELKTSVSENISVIVVFQDGLSPKYQENLLKIAELEHSRIKHYQNFPMAVVQTTRKDLSSVEGKLASISGILQIFLDSTHKVDLLTNPSGATLENEENWWLDAIGAMGSSFNGSNVRIAILDTGIYTDHADFSSKIPQTTQINFATYDGTRNSSDYQDVQGHGTHVAGIAAGTGASSSGMYRGVAPGASLLNVKTLNNYGGITDSDVIDVVDWIITQDNADIISMSFRIEYQGTVNNPIAIALNTAAEHGIVPVAAAGNYGPFHFTSTLPATAPSVISVGAIDRDLNVPDFSSIGPTFQGNTAPDILAPGVDIIAPESRNSLIGRTEEYTDSVISGSEPYSNYIALSGTSMATPMVAGAIALILDAYPDLTPEGVRAALYQGAYLPDHYMGRYGDSGIGAGIINVSASINWLSSLVDPNSIVQAFPDTLPYEPYDLLAYPGDFQRFNISLYSSGNTPVTLDITVPESQNLVITPETTLISFSNHAHQSVQFGVKILENATPGLETGSILLNNSITGDLLEQIDYSINITYPQGRIYFDSLHGMNDLFPEWSSGYSQIQIFDAMKILHQNGYQLIYEMDNWTKITQPQSKSHLLTPDLLSTIDIVVLQTPLIAYSPLEVNALEDFSNNGGSILILGTRSQTLATDSINSLLEKLNAEMTIQKENILNYTDAGFGYILDRYSVIDVNVTSPIFETGDEFSFWYGPIIEVSGSSQIFAQLQGNPVVAAHESLSGGKIVLWSDFHWLRNDIFDVSHPDAQRKILLNLFEYLNTQSRNSYSIIPSFNSTVQTNGDVELSLSILNSNTGLPITDRIYGNTLNTSIISPAGIDSPLILLSQGNGIYYNNSFNLGVTDYRPYIVQINISSPSGIITKEYKLYRIDGSNEVDIGSPSFSDPSITRSPGSSTTIQYTGTSSTLNATLFGTFSTDSFYSTKLLDLYSINMDAIGIQYNHIYSITGNEPAGLAVFYATAISPNNYTNFEVTRSYLKIENHLPSINEEESLFNGNKFSDTRSGNSLHIIQVNNRDTLNILVKAEEIVAYETQSNELYTIVYYTAATSAGSSYDIIYPNNIPTSILNYDSSQDKFTGGFKVPKQLTFTGAQGSVEVSQQSQNANEIIYFSILWITVRDEDGGAYNYVILLYVNIVFDWQGIKDYLPLIIAIVAIIAIIITVTVMLRKRRIKKAGHYRYSEPTGPKKYCMYCGRQIDNSYLVCPYCGKELPQS